MLPAAVHCVGGFSHAQKKENSNTSLFRSFQVFFVCHAARITLDVYEFSNVDLVKKLKKHYKFDTY